MASQTHWPRGQMQSHGQIQPHAAGSGWAGRRPQLLFFKKNGDGHVGLIHAPQLFFIEATLYMCVCVRS